MTFGITRKLFAGFGVVLVLLLIVGLTGRMYTGSLAAEFEELYADNVRAAVQLNNAERGLWELRFALPNYFLADVATREVGWGKWKERREQS
jgi:chemoreceptor-like protein with four helix bundle sensory module